MPALFSTLSLKTMFWLMVILLITTFCFGGLAVVMYQNQTEIKQTLKDTKKALKDEKAESQEQEKKFNSCMGSIAEINKAISDNALAARLNEDLSQGLASAAMAQLPALIHKDKQLGQQPAAATAWVRELFQ